MKKKKHVEIGVQTGGVVSSSGKLETLTQKNSMNSSDVGVIIRLASGDKVHAGQIV